MDDRRAECEAIVRRLWPFLDEKLPDSERELATCLEPMIDRLPEHYREALVLADLEGVKQREVA